MMKCGLCREEIKDGKYFTIYQCKEAESKLIQETCEKDFNDEKYEKSL